MFNVIGLFNWLLINLFYQFILISIQVRVIVGKGQLFRIIYFEAGKWTS